MNRTILLLLLGAPLLLLGFLGAPLCFHGEGVFPDLAIRVALWLSASAGTTLLGLALLTEDGAPRFSSGDARTA